MITFYVLKSNRSDNGIYHYFRNFPENYPGFFSTEDYMDAMAWNKRQQAVDFLKANGLDADFHVEAKQDECFPEQLVY